MTRWIGFAAVLLACAVLVSSSARGAPAAKMSLDDALKALGSYKFGQSRVALTVISDAARDSYETPAKRAALAGKLAAMLSKAGVTTDAKRFICRKLSIIGTSKEVPALAALLGDKELSNMSRYALERIPTEEALEALRSGLGKTSGLLRVGVINSLGERGDEKAAPELVKILGGSDAEAAEAAAAALGKIGGAKVLADLRRARGKAGGKMKTVLTNACLLCADSMVAAGKKSEAAAVYKELYDPGEPKPVRIAAMGGLVSARGAAAASTVIEALRGKDADLRAAAGGHVRRMGGKELTKAFAAELDKLPKEAKVMLLDALGERGDAAALGGVAAAVGSDDAAVRLAAIRAVGKLGGAASVAVLAARAGSDNAAEQAAATAALGRLRGKGVDEAIVSAMGKANAKAKARLVKTLADRNAVSASPALVKAAGDSDPGVRVEAIKALARVGDAKSVGPMIDLLVACKDARERGELVKAVAAACRRVKDENARVGPVMSALGSAEGTAKADLLAVLGKVGGQKALAVLTSAAKDPSAAIQEAAVRAMTDWPDEGAAAALLSVAKGAKELKLRVLAMRGFVRVVSKVSDANKAIGLYQQGMAAAGRVEEKKLILGGISNVKNPRAVTALMKCLDDPALKNEAAAGIFKLNRDGRFRRAAQRELKAARKKIETVFKGNKNILRQAAKLPR